MYLRKNDMVMVISGKEKGKSGKILTVLPDQAKAIVEKLNIVKRHQKPTQKMKQGGIVEKPLPLQTAKLMILCATCAKPVRIGIEVEKDGSKRRICKKCKGSIDQ